MLTKIFPFLDWFKNFNSEALRRDLVAGVSVALVLVPQSMAYAQLAGLPAYYGLYASFLPPMLAALFGSSRQLATGPVAVVSLMTAASLEPLATAGSQAFVAYAVLLALSVGLFQFALGVARLGLVVNFLSHPVINGFTNAAAIIIATSQLSKLFGVSVDSADHHYETIIQVLKAAWYYTHWPTLGMGVLAFAIMYGLKYLNPRLPFVLAAVVVTTALSWALGFERQTRVDVSAVQSENVRHIVKRYNEAYAEIARLSALRAEMTPRLMELESRLGKRHLDTVRLGQEIEVVSLHIDQLRAQAVVRRASLRAFLFRAETGPDGRVRFRLDGETPTGRADEGRTWRLKVGLGPLDEKSLRFFGGGEVVGNIPQGLPAFGLPRISFNALAQLLPYAVIISLLGFMEATSIAKAMAAKTGQRLDPNQELIGQGVANMVGALGQSYPVSGSFSRSAVNLQSGAVSGLSSVVTGLMVVAVLLFFTPLLYHLPQASLAAIIMMAVAGLINVSGFIHAWKAQRYDGIISVISFLATLAFAPDLDKGIMIGVVLSLGVFLYKSMRPRVANLAMHPDCSFRDADHYGLRQCQHIALIRFDGPLFFANASFLEEQITERMRAMPALRHILLVANGINDLDASGEEVLSLMVDRVRSAGVEISLSGVKENVLEVIRRTYLYEKIGEKHIFPTQAMAVAAIHGPAHRDSTEKECPLIMVCPIDKYREPTSNV